MVTGWTLLIVLAVAYGNELVSLIGVPTRVREGMRLWASDEEYYLPRHLGYMVYCRAMCIQLGIAGTYLALLAIVSPGDSKLCEADVGIAHLFFIGGIGVASTIPSDFRETLVPFRGEFWRVALAAIITISIYIISGIEISH